MKRKTTIFHRTKRPTKQELQNLTGYYNKLTAELPQGWALEKLDSPDKCHYLMLLKIADYCNMGKSFSILTAFKMGYLYAKGKIELGIPDYYYDDSYWAQEYRERVSKILAQTENADTLARIYHFAKRAGKDGADHE